MTMKMDFLMTLSMNAMMMMEMIENENGNENENENDQEERDVVRISKGNETPKKMAKKEVAEEVEGLDSSVPWPKLVLV
jgi:hypothetical protein